MRPISAAVPLVAVAPPGRSGPVRRVRTVVGLALAVILVASAGCSSGSGFDRAAAVDRVVAAGNGRITRAQAECYVDRVVDEVGSGPLAPGTEPTAEQVPKLTSIRIDCIGVTNIGTVPEATMAPELDPGGTAPRRRGDDPVLDALYDACAAGDGAACDRLYDEAPVGSEYETFAGTCGGRAPATRCGAAEPTSTGP